MRFPLRLMATLCVAGISLCAAAQGTFPDRPIRMMSPSQPGGVADVILRVFAGHMAPSLGQPVLVENRIGGGGVPSTEAILRAPADGYLLATGFIGHVVNPLIMPSWQFDFERDFAPVTLLTMLPSVISVHPSVPAKNLQELMALARRSKMSYASSGLSTSTHLAGELLKSMAGVDLVHIPYKGGAPAMNDVLGGQVPIIIDSVVTTLPHVRAGKLRALAVTSSNRLGMLPDVPTVAESGFPGYEASGWIGIIGRVGTPAPVVKKLADEFQRIAQLPSVRTQLSEKGAEIAVAGPESFSAFVKAERAKWSPVVKKAGIVIN
ncbi:MAG: tripartite tricarboxylate transporter substrate binding protein [Burkholderiaceae bacterium]|nr:tripartite tricarboxylate transporter substrate binding protein [Burkholderiaceae bacterium]